MYTYYTINKPLGPVFELIIIRQQVIKLIVSAN